MIGLFSKSECAETCEVVQSCAKMSAQYNTELLLYKTEHKTENIMADSTDEFKVERAETMALVLTQVYRTTVIMVWVAIAIGLAWLTSIVKSGLNRKKVDEERILLRGLEILASEPNTPRPGKPQVSATTTTTVSQPV